MVTSATSGTASWVDLSTPDIAAATAFYRDLLGWSVERQETPLGDYHIGMVDELEVAGLMAAPAEQPGMPATWTVFFSVDDVDGRVATVQQAGGTVLDPPTDVPGGRIAVVADATGAVLGIISHARPAGPWLSDRRGAVCWVELLTRDPTAAEAFYAIVFGWKAETQDDGQSSYTMFSIDDGPVAGMLRMPDEVPAQAPAHWAVYFAVDDCAATERRAAELGGEVVRPTAPFGAGRFAVLADPAGATFDVMEWSSPA